MIFKLPTRIACLVAVSIGASLAGCNTNGMSSTSASSAAGTTSTAPTGVTPPATSTPPPAATTNAVSISGTPAASVIAGSTYQFQPVSKDANGNALSFSVTNLPAWAKFDKTSGLLSGTPASADVGKTAQIVITASNGHASAALGAFVITVNPRPGIVAELSWVASPTAANGSVANIVGYRIYYGTSASSLSHVVDITDAAASNYTVTDLTQGTWYFAVTAYNGAKVESTLSAVVPITL